jgi:MFS family permease
MSKAPTKKQLKANIWKLYLFSIFEVSIGFTLPTIVLFFGENGMNLTQVMLLQSIFSIMWLILEIPSGYFADTYGRRKTLIIASLLFIIAYSIFSIGNNFSIFIIAEMFMATGISLVSGADSALMYDTLKELKRENEYKKIWGRKRYYGLLAMALMNLVGGYIATYSLRLPWYFALAGIIILFPICLTLVEPTRHKLLYKKGYARTLLGIIYKKVFKKTKLKWIIIYGAVIFTFFHGAFWFYQPYFKLTGIDVIYFGGIFAIYSIFAAFVSKHAHQIEEYLGQKQSLILLTILTGLGLLLMNKLIFIWSFTIIFIHQFVRAFYHIIISDYVNQLTESKVRATVLSVQNMASRILYASLIPIFGYMADIYTLQQTLGIMGITLLIVGGSILFLLHRYKLV